MASVGLHGVTRTFPDGTCAVRDLDLRAESGEILVIAGPSGCGKTTILRMVAGLDQPTAGVIAIDDKAVNHLPARERDVAMVAAEHGLLPHLSARDNLAFGLRMRGTPPPETERRVQAEARVLGLRRVLDRRPRVLAAGERQRVAVGRATTRLPRVFLFDEPLAPLDAHERARLRAELARLQAGLGVTTLYVTHDQQEAMALGHRLVVLDHGVLQQIGEPAALYHRPENTFVAAFIGSPPMNLFSATLRFDGSVAHVDVGGASLRLTDTQRRALGTRRGVRWTVGLRPENLHLLKDRPAPPDRRFEVAATGVEHLGSQVLVSGTAGAGGGAGLVARLPATTRIRPGETVPLAVDVDAMHFFDPVTGFAELHGRRP